MCVGGGDSMRQAGVKDCVCGGGGQHETGWG